MLSLSPESITIAPPASADKAELKKAVADFAAQLAKAKPIFGPYVKKIVALASDQIDLVQAHVPPEAPEGTPATPTPVMPMATPGNFGAKLRVSVDMTVTYTGMEGVLSAMSARVERAY